MKGLRQLESRMREIRQSGSEGGGASTRSPYPYCSCCRGFNRRVEWRRECESHG
jgi:hypothetical protein